MRWRSLWLGRSFPQWICSHPRSLTASLPPENRPGPKRKGSSSKHHFSGAKMLNFWGGTTLMGFSESSFQQLRWEPTTSKLMKHGRENGKKLALGWSWSQYHYANWSWIEWMIRMIVPNQFCGTHLPVPKTQKSRQNSEGLQKPWASKEPQRIWTFFSVFGLPCCFFRGSGFGCALAYWYDDDIWAVTQTLVICCILGMALPSWSQL